MARTVGDAALMLSAMAGPDDRSPLSYPVDGREFLKAVKAPSVKGWHIAWTPDLGLVEIDHEVCALFERAVATFRALGARVDAACPDMSDVPEIVRLTRGLLMVARHADKLAEWRAVLQPGLVENTEQGLALTPATSPKASCSARASGCASTNSSASAICWSPRRWPCRRSRSSIPTSSRSTEDPRARRWRARS